MKILLLGSLVALVTVGSAMAQDARVTTIEPNELTADVKHKPPLQLNDQQRREIQDALITAHSDQKRPDKYQATVGEKVPTVLKLDAMPAPLIYRQPALKQYAFVKLEKELLVVDPMDTQVVAIIPRKFPNEQTAPANVPNGQTGDPASKGDEAETGKKN